MSDSKHVPTASPAASAEMLEELIAAFPERIASYLEKVQPAAGVPLFRRLPPDRAADAAGNLNPRIAASLLREIHPATAASICAGIERSKVSMILTEMAPDGRVDILSHVQAELREQLIQKLSVSKAAEVRRLESYPADSAGGIMTTEAIALRGDGNRRRGRGCRHLRSCCPYHLAMQN